MKRVTRSENEQKEKGKKRFRGTLHDYYMCTYVTISFKIPFFLFISNFSCDCESSLAPSFFFFFAFFYFLPFVERTSRSRYRFRLILSERERPLVFSSLLSFFSSYFFFFFFILFSFVTLVKARSSAGRGTRRKHKHPPIDLSWSRRILVSAGFFALR